MSRRTKLTDGRKGKGRGPMSQKRHLAGARVEQAAQQAEAARPLTEEEQLEQDLAGLQDSVHGLGDIWRVTKARRGEDVIFHAVADSDAQLTPANLKALKIPELSVFVPLFEIEIQKDLGAAPTVRVFGRALAKEQLHTVIQEAGQSAGAQDSWADLVEEACSQAAASIHDPPNQEDRSAAATGVVQSQPAFNAVTSFPFTSPALNALSLHPRILGAVSQLVRQPVANIRLCGASLNGKCECSSGCPGHRSMLLQHHPVDANRRARGTVGGQGVRVLVGQQGGQPADAPG